MMRDDAAARCCKYGFIGVGNMASALIAGLIDTGAVKPDNIMVFDIDASRCTPFTARGAYAAESAAEVCGSCAYIYLAVKPYQMRDCLAGIKDARFFDEAILVSIAASVPTDFIASQLGREAGVIRVMPSTPMLVGKGASAVTANRFVPAARLDEFVLMRTRVGHDPIELGGDGVVLSEKLADQLGVGVGDEVALTEQDAIGNATGSSHTATVTGVMENYIYNYVFIGPDRYDELMGGRPPYTTLLAVVSDDPDTRAQLTEQLGAIEGVQTIAYNDETIDSFYEMLSSVNMIVVVLVAAAAALAFIVLYNLTNINITERMREIATLKVLGFTPREVDAYIYREIVLLSAIGSLVGLVLGVWMEGFVVVTAEVDQVMFGRVIHPASFAIAFALTMAFTVLVMVAMRRKLAGIDMVESLKSNE